MMPTQLLFSSHFTGDYMEDFSKVTQLIGLQIPYPNNMFNNARPIRFWVNSVAEFSHHSLDLPNFVLTEKGRVTSGKTEVHVCEKRIRHSARHDCRKG
jgi:hypothetical protein